MRLEAIEDTNLHEAVATLCRGFPSRPSSFWKDGVARLSAYRRATAGPPIGRLMRVDDRPVGVILTIASKHRAGGREHDIVNLSSWYVDESYRWLAPRMLQSIVADDNVVYTDLSPTPQTARINERLGFRTAAEGVWLYPLPWTAISAPPDGRMVPFEDLPDDVLPDAEREVLARHQEMGSIAAALRAEGKYCAFLFQPTRRKGLPAARLLLAPDRRTVTRHRGAISRFLLDRGMLFLTFHGDKTHAGHDGGLLWNRSASVQVKGEWDSDQIDHTYSELVFLRL